MLDATVVDRIHTRLLARYGDRWLNKWAGVDPRLVKADWGRVLSGMSKNAIDYALENMPEDWPPSATQFRSIGFAAPRPPDDLSLEGPPRRRDPARLVAALQRWRQIAADRRPKQWALDLRDRERAGAKLHPTQMVAWRTALREGMPAEQTTGGLFQGIDPAHLPPGMRDSDDPDPRYRRAG